MALDNTYGDMLPVTSTTAHTKTTPPGKRPPASNLQGGDLATNPQTTNSKKTSNRNLPEEKWNVAQLSHPRQNLYDC